MITLIEKKGKDRKYLENWRSISLIDVDAKIAFKAIAMRIKKSSQNLFIVIKRPMLIGTLVNQTIRLAIYSNTPVKMKLKLFSSQLILRERLTL